MLQWPDLPLDEETTSFTDIPRGEFSYLQNSNIDVSNGETQRRIVQCDIQEGLDFSITYHLIIIYRCTYEHGLPHVHCVLVFP